MNNTYYQDELQYLREVGPEFARANPELARLLADRGSDPDAERILEGVAFLCGRIRQKLDDELPELTANLLTLLWPHYLRPIPSMSILELLPETGAMQAPLEVAAGAEFASVPVDGTRCRYRSSWPVMLRPWGVREARLESLPAAPPRLVLQLGVTGKAKLEDLQLESVRFYLAGEAQAAFSLYLLYSAHVKEIVVSNGLSGTARREVALEPGQITPAGLDRSEAVLRWPAGSFAGYRLLQEYLVFKERFLFIDLLGLDRAVQKLELTDSVEVAITFDRRLDPLPVVSRENLRLHCVPIINLFEHPADPIRLQHDRVEYLIQPSRTGVADHRHLEVFSVDEVRGVVRSPDRETSDYLPFYSFEHQASRSPGADGIEGGRRASFYQVSARPNVLGGDPRLGTDSYVSFVPGSDLPASDETISIELTCTNRSLPAELRAGDIQEPTDSSPTSTAFRNILKPTPTIAPPFGRSLHWRLIAHMSLNYVTLTDADHFKELIRIYDFQSEHDAQRALAHQRMLEGIVSIRSSFDERMLRGAPLRGAHVEVELNEDHFAGEGDAYLFARVLDRFMGLYATLNAHCQLTVRFVRSGRIYRFPVRWGEQITPAGARA